MNIIKMYIIFSVCFRPQKKTKVIHFQERIKLQTTLREQLPSGWGPCTGQTSPCKQHLPKGDTPCITEIAGMLQTSAVLRLIIKVPGNKMEHVFQAFCICQQMPTTLLFQPVGRTQHSAQWPPMPTFWKLSVPLTATTALVVTSTSCIQPRPGGILSWWSPNSWVTATEERWWGWS